MFMPVLFLALVGGQLADRFDRRQIFVAHPGPLGRVRGGARGRSPGWARVSPGWIYGTSIVLGIGYALSIPTMHALIPSLVGPASSARPSA